MKVSVIIPTYNRANLLAEAIDSVLAQSYTDYELIVIDDGSTDDTERVVHSYGDRVRYYRQINGGVNNARNHAVRLAKGEYIALLDNDDLWLPFKLELEVAILECFPSVAAVFSNFSIYRSSSDITYNGIQTWFTSPQDWQVFYPESYRLGDVIQEIPAGIDQSTSLYIGDIYRASMESYFVLPSTSLYRRNLVPTDVQFVEYDPICGDWDFFARLSRDYPLAYLDLETTHNRSHEDEVRLTRTEWKKQLEFRLDMLERLYLQDQEFVQRHRALVEKLYQERVKKLALQYLLSNEQSAARETLRKLDSISTKLDMNILVLLLASKMPGVHFLLKALRWIRSK